MKKSFLLMIPLLLAVVNCNDNYVPEDSDGLVGRTLTVQATLGDSPKTKTVLKQEGVYWQNGDAINMFYGNKFSGRFVTELSEDSKSAEFNGQLNVVTGVVNEQGDGLTTQDFWAIYPYDESNTCQGDGVTLTIPSSQPGMAGTFAPNLNPTVATAPGLSLPFYNVGSWLMFSVQQSGITSVMLRGNGGEDIAGKVRVIMDANGHPAASAVEGEGAKSITILPEDKFFAPGEYYYIVLIPQTLSQGFKLTFNKGNYYTAERNIDKEITFSRNVPRSMENADKDLIFKEFAVDLGLSVKWSTCNLGASKPEDAGYYYAWGETTGNDGTVYQKLLYNWKHYKWMESGYSDWTHINKYTFADGKTEGIWYHDGEARDDGMWSLQHFHDSFWEYNVDDAAYYALKGKFRIATPAEWAELMNPDNCIWEWNTEALGFKVTSKKEGYTGNSIFIPITGFREDNKLMFEGVNKAGYYWSSDLYWEIGIASSGQSSDRAWNAYLVPEMMLLDTAPRYLGYAIRPIVDKD